VKRESTVKAKQRTTMRNAPREPARRKVAFKQVRTHDWSKFDALTNADVLKAARSDPDAQPLSDAQLKRMKRPNPKVVRRALGLSQEQFADVFGIPIGTLRDWEQGRAEPDQAARSYLKVIAHDPEIVRRALKVLA
jgi:putative transcriptional regulator